jgi:hypothetical protein
MKALLVLGLVVLVAAGITSCNSSQEASVAPANAVASAKNGVPTAPPSATVVTPTPPTPVTPMMSVSAVMPGGAWTVRYFVKNVDQSASFSGVTFVFSANNTMTAFNKSGVSIGTTTWASTLGSTLYYGALDRPIVTLTLPSNSGKKTVNPLASSWILNTGSTINEVYLDNIDTTGDEHVILNR